MFVNLMDSLVGLGRLISFDLILELSIAAAEAIYSPNKELLSSSA